MPLRGVLAECVSLRVRAFELQQQCWRAPPEDKLTFILFTFLIYGENF